MQEPLIPNDQLPEIPAKRYFTIGEVSHLCGVKTHVLRYWEQEFPSLKPMKRRGNRRYYQHDDVLLIRQIRSLLYEHGYTISGARQKIQGVNLADPEVGEKTEVYELDNALLGGDVDLKKIIRQLEATVKVLQH